MSGHSKWATIKRKKEKTDSQRGKIFTKLGRELAIAVKEGGGPDPNNNAKLRDAIAKAKGQNMPNDNIMRSIKKAAGEGNNVHYEEVTYEGYGPGGVAVIVESLTDNRNRTAADVRHIFDKNGGSLGATGCVSWMFDRQGVILLDKSAGDEETVMTLCLELGAEDFNSESDEGYEVITTPENFSSLRDGLEARGIAMESAEIAMVPQNTAELKGDAQAAFDKMLDMLEDNDDVQDIFHNAEIE